MRQNRCSGRDNFARCFKSVVPILRLSEIDIVGKLVLEAQEPHSNEYPWPDMLSQNQKPTCWKVICFCAFVVPFFHFLKKQFAFTQFNGDQTLVCITHSEDLLKHWTLDLSPWRFWFSRSGDGAWESVLLTSYQVVLIQLVWGLHLRTRALVY